MTEVEMKSRLRRFASRVIRLAEAIPRSRSGDVIAKQIIRSGTSIGANYRSACRGRSRAEFLSKLSIAEEEADETGYWLELIQDAELLPARLLGELRKEAGEILAILVASIKTGRSRTMQARPPQSKIQIPKSKIHPGATNGR